MGKKFVVLGGAGAMGRIIVRDLFEFSSPQDEIWIADYDFPKAHALAESYKNHRVKPIFVNVKDKKKTVQSLNGTCCLINSVQYQLNIQVMEIALALKAHYIDLGGLFHTTRKQLAYHHRFKEAGLLAILGMGAAPGITNILSRYGCDQLDTVEEIHTRVASIDRTKYDFVPALPVSYSLQTILEEFSLEPAVFTKGEFKFVPPMSGNVPHRFPPPLGMQRPMYTLHSEVATLPTTFQEKGVKEVSFKIAFDPTFVERVRFLRDLGLASHESIKVGDTAIKPIELVNKIAMSQPPAQPKGRLNQYEIVRAIVKGMQKNKKVTFVLDCHCQGIPDWNMGVDVDTGCPPSIAAQMISSGEIQEMGVQPPEMVIPPKEFFNHLKKRHVTIKVTQKSGWELPC